MPAATGRLFGEYATPIDWTHHRDFVIGRLLEEGDREDLRWLFATVGGEEIEAWWHRHGGRQLSRRSRALWRCHFGGAPAAQSLAPRLWPLA